MTFIGAVSLGLGLGRGSGRRRASGRRLRYVISVDFSGHLTRRQSHRLSYFFWHFLFLGPNLTGTAVGLGIFWHFLFFWGPNPTGKPVGLGIFLFWITFSVWQKIKENGKKNQKTKSF
jgi:hypothetical protein